MKPAVHILGLQHVPVAERFSTCAYTAKIRNLCKMLRSIGHKVILYGVEGSDVTLADEFVPVVKAATWEKDYGKHDFHKWQYEFSSSHDSYKEFNSRVPYELWQRNAPGETAFLLCPWGRGHKDVADLAPPNLVKVEPGIGYGVKNIFCQWLVFESLAWQHFCYGKWAARKDEAVRAKDAEERRMASLEHNFARVMQPPADPDDAWQGGHQHAIIPQAVDPAAFPFKKKKGDYCLFMARVNANKGYAMAAEVCEQLGERLLVVGQQAKGSVKEALGYLFEKKGVEYRQAVEPAERAELLANAKLLFCLTDYMEPWGGVAIEAQMCGTPVVASAWGAFTENVLNGITGWLCCSRGDVKEAVRRIGELRPAACRQWALNFSLDRVAAQYDEFFQRVAAATERRERDSWGLDWRTLSVPRP